MMVIQVGAKLGFVPWAIDELPFSDEPTMIVGIDTYGSGNNATFALVATTDENFSSYFSQSAKADKVKLQDFIKNSLELAIKNFKDENEISPRRIIILREGISRGQRAQVKEKEIPEIREAMKKYEQNQPISLVYVCVNKMTNAKFFHSNDKDARDVKSPFQGTYIYKNICSNEQEEFYLISQMARHGLSNPTNYFILENDICEKEKKTPERVKDDLAKLAFKLSFLYYNTIGSIKVPAPIHYANKMSNHIGMNSKSNHVMDPHPHLAKIHSLFYI